MAKTLKDIEITDENGQAVSPDDLSDFLDDRDFVPFTLEGKNGQTRTFTIEVDNSQVSAADVARYRKAMAVIAVEAEEAQERMGAEDGIETEVENIDMKEVVAVIDMELEFARHEAELLSKLVVASNFPPKDLSNPAVLIERTGAGPAARKALHSYFFGDSTEPEEATGNSETAPTSTASDTSEATDNSEVTPPTS